MGATLLWDKLVCIRATLILEPISTLDLVFLCHMSELCAVVILSDRPQYDFDLMHDKCLSDRYLNRSLGRQIDHCYEKPRVQGTEAFVIT